MSMDNRIQEDTAQYVANKVCQSRLMPNDLRHLYVEGLVHCALRNNFPEAGWIPSPAGKPWNLENGDHIRLQVKQAAALPACPASENSRRARQLSFDIYPGISGRQTHIYVFAWHPETDPESADHRDATQWRFCVMPEDELPEPASGQKTQRISLNRLQTLAAGLGLKTAAPYQDLAATVNRIAAVILEADLADGRLADEVMGKVRSGQEHTPRPS